MSIEDSSLTKNPKGIKKIQTVSTSYKPPLKLSPKENNEDEFDENIDKLINAVMPKDSIIPDKFLRTGSCLFHFYSIFVCVRWLAL